MSAYGALQKVTKHNVHRINGLPVPLYITQLQMDSLRDIELFSDDIWIVTYPKSGTAWTQQIVRSILCKGDDNKKISEAVPWLEAAKNNSFLSDVDVSALESPRAFKSHMPYHLMPCGLPNTTPCKYIYVGRMLLSLFSTTISHSNMLRTSTGTHSYHGFSLANCILATILSMC